MRLIKPCQMCHTYDCHHKQSGRNRAKAFTHEFQVEARKHVKRDSLVESGKKGYDALVAKKGRLYAGRKAADYRRQNPSDLEAIVGDWLFNLVANFKTGHPGYCEVEIDEFFVDFVVGNFCIEVHGSQWHEKLELRQDQPARDKRKYKTLTGLGYTVVILPESDIRSGKAKQTLIKLLGDKSD
jgi:hypothetical protein